MEGIFQEKPDWHAALVRPHEDSEIDIQMPERKDITMAKDVYEALAEHLDTLPTGYPRTENGSEMRILRRLFTPQDAELAIHLTIIPEEPRVIARRSGISVSEATSRLKEMDKKGVIMSMHEKGKVRYMAAQYLYGFWEAQINRLTPELVEDAIEYSWTLLHPDRWPTGPIHRTIPINTSVSVQDHIMSYEMAEEIVRRQPSRSIMNCVCRQGMRVLGKGCDKTEETCMTFGVAADYIARTGRGRKISLEESLDILRRAEEEGLVLQPDNAQDPISLCACCGCCCGPLLSIKRHPKPNRVVTSAFLASLDVTKCTGCGICTKRCPMEAIQLVEKKAVLDVERCIGCGLCASKCPTHCMFLVRKPQTEQMDVAKDHIKSQIKIAQARGRLGVGELVRLQLKSKLDRMLARMTSVGPRPGDTERK
jgi:Na+-translocating ferredoxin:NAD+ oxidoreductase subunit B